VISVKLRLGWKIMQIFVPKELHPIERRVPLLPSGVAKLVRLGAEIEIEQGLGASLACGDSEYENAGAKISTDRVRSLEGAEMLLRLRKPPLDEVDRLKKGCIHASFLDPFNERELVLRLAAAEVTAISMEMIPRTAVAQKMDVLSSQANLSGYVAVILAATRASRIFPMLITPAGTIKPLRVLVIGVGVAGLQAIATARRLGAAVEAFDTRPVVEEQVKSLSFFPSSINHALRRHEVLAIQIPDLKDSIVPLGISSQLLQFADRILESSEVALLC